MGPKSRMNEWKEVSGGDIKNFLGHLIVMGLVHKANMDKYWVTSEVMGTPFFGKYLSKNNFKLLLSNIHLTDNTKMVTNDKLPGYDPLYKVRPFVTLCREKFRSCYKPNKELAFDEGTCPFKGRLKFKVYQPMKPAKFGVRIYTVSESRTAGGGGYICGFSIYSGAVDPFSCDKTANCRDTVESKTTKIVMGLLETTKLLDQGHHVYMDNYYSSPELFEELYLRDTYACGTVRKNRRNLPLACVEAELKENETVFRRSDIMLAIKWCEKRTVFMISTIHQADMIEIRKRYNGKEKVSWKPESIVEYIKYMRGVDVGDQLMSYNNCTRRSKKWWRKLFFHLFGMVMMNAFVLHKKFAPNKVSNENFKEMVASSLIKEYLEEGYWSLPVKSNRLIKTVSQVQGNRHYLSFLPSKDSPSRRVRSKKCVGCIERGEKPKYTSYWCKDCGKPMCVDPCFRLMHS